MADPGITIIRRKVDVTRIRDAGIDRTVIVFNLGIPALGFGAGSVLAEEREMRGDAQAVEVWRIVTNAVAVASVVVQAAGGADVTVSVASTSNRRTGREAGEAARTRDRRSRTAAESTQAFEAVGPPDKSSNP